MYEYIIGKYAGMNRDYIVVENSGIGYKIFTSGSTMSQLPQMNEEVKVFLQQIVREDFAGLYGFLTKDELSLFNLLLTVTGVGAKAALSLLSICSELNLKYAIASKDEKTIMRAPGIGKKMAQRIILELQDKVDAGAAGSASGAFGVEAEAAEASSREAMYALLSLGYTEKEAAKALKEVDQKDTVENIIKKCLKYLMG
ncbi:MAG TPA: Holliday junction branch migration protein RuvA [Clostridiaceae bacterium]|nr:Holliday junction branch migration protein RuvA [Clostridiaceae bacterium]